jgi:phenylpropionate dioxygenase-like ring-hydroxylating dioxygenase large terminal subunit
VSQQHLQQLRQLMAYEASRNAPPADFPRLPPLPSARYTDAAFHALEQDILFRKTWLLAAHLDEIPEPGCFQRWDIAGAPVVLVHADNGDIHALINRCSHRGAPVAMDERGKRKRLTCPYHGWSYSHEGELLAVRESRDFAALDIEALSLQRLRCERLGKLIFVNFDPQAVNLRESLGALVEEWAEFDLDNCRLSRRDRFSVRCNWKIAMEANLEVYHVPSIHGKTVSPVLDARRNVNSFYPGGHSRMVAPIPEGHAQPAWTSRWPEIPTAGDIARTCTQSYSVFPNLVMPLNQFVIPPIQFWPDGIDQCIVETWTMAPDWGADTDRGPDMWTQDDGARPSRVLREDIDMSEAIQAALDPRSNRGIPLSYQEARIYHWHQSADAVVGAAQIPEGLRVQPVLEDAWLHPNEPRLRGPG